MGDVPGKGDYSGTMELEDEDEDEDEDLLCLVVPQEKLGGRHLNDSTLPPDSPSRIEQDHICGHFSIVSLDPYCWDIWI